MLNKETLRRFDSATGTVKKILKLNYNNVLMASEIDQCVDPVIEINKSYLVQQLKRYSLWWLAILVLFSSSFITANRILSPEKLNPSENIQTDIKPNDQRENVEKEVRFSLPADDASSND